MSNNDVQQKIVDVLLLRKPSMNNEGAQSSAAWLISFTDVIALMLTFFVLLYAMSDPVMQKWENKMGLSPDSYGEYAMNNNAGVNEGRNINYEAFRQGEDLDYLESVLRELLPRSDVLSAIEVVRKKSSLMLYLQNIENLSPKLIKELSLMFNNLDNQIIVTSSAGENSFKQFRKLQGLTDIMRDHGYKRSIPIRISAHMSPEDSRIVMIIQTHDGHRITRE